jgi:hypothetical protein
MALVDANGIGIIPYKPREQFLPFHERRERWAIIVAHRRAGKTVACINDKIKRAVLSPKEMYRAGYIAPYLKQAKDYAEILKLSDEFGQYTLVLKCSACNHERHAQPHALARLCGWDARIDAVTRRLRCSKCGKKQCAWRAYPPSKPRGHSSLPR